MDYRQVPLGIPLRGMQTEVVCFAAQELFTQRRPRIRGMRIGRENGDRQIAFVRAKRFRSADTGGTTADNYQSRRVHIIGVPALDWSTRTVRIGLVGSVSAGRNRVPDRRSITDVDHMADINPFEGSYR